MAQHLRLLGRDRCTSMTHLCRYDPKTNTWSKQVPMLTSRTRAAAAVLEGHLYVMGGSDGDRALSSGKAIQCIALFYEERAL